MSKQFNKDRFEDEYVPLHSGKLQDVIGDYKACIEYLEKSGVVVVNPQYIVGEQCKGYKFTDEYQTTAAPFINLKQQFRNKLKRHEIARNGYTEHLNYITKWLNSDLQLNHNLVDEWINYNHDVKTTFPDLRDYNHIKQKYKCPEEQYKFSKLVAQRFKNNDFTHGQDQNVYRLHTNLTNMPSMMRNALTYKGQPLVSIDISNSHPYSAILLLINSFRLKRTNKPKTALQIDFGKKVQETIASFKQENKPSTTSQQNLLDACTNNSFPFKEADNSSEIDINSINNEDRLNIKDIKVKDKGSYIMLLKQSVSPINSEIERYIKLVTTGKFYEYLMQLFTTELGEGFNDRTTVKIEVLKLFFTANGFLHQPDAAAKKVFKKHFPTVYKIFSAIKKNDKADLPKLLQSIESYLILDVIAKRIARELPHAPIFTIHDSIATTIEYQDAVKKIMSEELESKIGIAPHLKVEYWQESNIHKNMQDLKNKISNAG
ncbi:hypothetical protein JCM19275_210 [Nonlabens ulvanivorans]|uniref:Uncharacterized protein n=1 Tax=Nonlabens ulvanivorans TaxID=906888 RepID=A0A090WGB9_NONUL|nr:hypothetical protein JCM19275_210 [Nonlabens ulvanivorans]